MLIILVCSHSHARSWCWSSSTSKMILCVPASHTKSGRSFPQAPASMTRSYSSTLFSLSWDLTQERTWRCFRRWRRRVRYSLQRVHFCSLSTHSRTLHTTHIFITRLICSSDLCSWQWVGIEFIPYKAIDLHFGIWQRRLGWAIIPSVMCWTHFVALAPGTPNDALTSEAYAICNEKDDCLWIQNCVSFHIQNAHTTFAFVFWVGFLNQRVDYVSCFYFKSLWYCQRL